MDVQGFQELFVAAGAAGFGVCAIWYPSIMRLDPDKRTRNIALGVAVIACSAALVAVRVLS